MNSMSISRSDIIARNDIQDNVEEIAKKIREHWKSQINVDSLYTTVLPTTCADTIKSFTLTSNLNEINIPSLITILDKSDFYKLELLETTIDSHIDLRNLDFRTLAGLFLVTNLQTNSKILIYNFQFLEKLYGEYLNGKLILVSNNKDNIKEFIKFYEEESEKKYIKGFACNRVIYFNGYDLDPIPEKDFSMNWENLFLKGNMKEQILNDIKWFFTENARDFYKTNNFLYKRGYLFCGSPGNGKTTFIKNLMADLLDKKFLLLRSSSRNRPIDAEAVIKAYELAKKICPCIIIFEDIDLIINPSNKQVLLNTLDGLEGIEGVLTIATTNKPQDIDSSLASRPSRFDRVINFDDPDLKNRLKYITSKFKDYNDDQKKEIAKLTDSLSFAFLKELYITVSIRNFTSNKLHTVDEIKALIKKLKIHQKEVIKDIEEGKAGFTSSQPFNINDDDW